MGYTEAWIESEFCSLRFGDVRLERRFRSLFSGLMKKAQDNISSVFESWSEIKASYRFLKNPKVTAWKILQPHKESTTTRITRYKQVLLLHDTTYIDYRKRTKTEGLDIITNTPITKMPVRGLMLHNSLAVSTQGIPLGIWGQYFVDRKEIRGKKISKNICSKKPIEEKESIRWIKAIRDFHQESNCQNVVHVADREADIYELFRDNRAMGEKFLIRARLDRAINKKTRRSIPSQKLFNFFENLPVKGYHKIKVQTRTHKEHRSVKLSVSYAEFTLSPPPNYTKNKNGIFLPNLRLWGIMAREPADLPEGEERICWLLLTNIPISNFKEALEKIEWYSYRWNVELFHKILKSGCAIEKAQLRNGETLKKYVTLKSLVAWRLFWITRMLNSTRGKSCEEVLSKREWTLLYRRFNQGTETEQPPTVEEACCWIARLGGGVYQSEIRWATWYYYQVERVGAPQQYDR